MKKATGFKAKISGEHGPVIKKDRHIPTTRNVKSKPVSLKPGKAR